MIADPFATAALRERVLVAWTAAPVRFREDANAEEELVLGGYRDRVVVELAQNAADAAIRAGTPGRMLLRVDEIEGRAVLVAANTGTALDAAGVLALATLRASAKREDVTAGAAPVGRFGVGFAAVLAVTDEPVIVSRHGGVRFSAAHSRDLVDEAARTAPGLAEELARRDGHVPVLRLPFPAEGAPPPGYDTAVLLPLRDAAAEDLVIRLLSEVGDPLLLALPGLAEVSVAVAGRAGRTVGGVDARWHVVRRSGELDPTVLADRPTEERARRSWSVTWAVPREPGAPADPLAALEGASGGAGLAGLVGGVIPSLPAVVYAPTPSDEPLPWPALLVATFPLDPSRRHVSPGPATDVIVRHAAQAFAELLTRRAADGAPIWGLVPVGLPAGPVDEALRVALLEILPTTPLLPDPIAPLLPDPIAPVSVEEASTGAPAGPRLLAPRDARALQLPAGADPAVVGVLAPWLAGLVVTPRGVGAVLEALGVRTITLADAIEQLPAVADPGTWRRTYGALAGLAEDPLAREALAALPVPLADGRVVHGVRGLLLPTGPPRLAAALGTLGLRTVHPDAAHPLLERLGAIAVDARSALELTAVGELVTALSSDEAGDVADDADADAVVDAVLGLVSLAVEAGRLDVGQLPHLADLWLTDVEGEVAPAGALALPGSPAADLFDPEEIGVVAGELVDRWGRATLASVGVLDRLVVLQAEDVPLDPQALDLEVDRPEPTAGRSASPAGAGPRGGDPRDLDGWEDWAEAALDAVAAGQDDSFEGGDPLEPVEATVLRLDAVRDLDLVRSDAWPRALAMIEEDPRLRAAVVLPARMRVRGGSDGSGGSPGASTADIPSYTAWWLNRRLAGGRAWADPQADRVLSSLLPPAPEVLAQLAPALRRALGAVADTTQLAASAVQALVDGLADPATELDAVTTLRIWASLARLAGTAGDIEPPRRVRVLDGFGTRVVDADQAVVVDEPALLQRTDLGLPVLVGSFAAASALARLLDLPLAGDLVEGVIDEATHPGTGASVPPAVRALLPGVPALWCEHDRLLVDGVDVDWWLEPLDVLPIGDGAGGGSGGNERVRVHACTVAGLAHALAWAADAWSSRAAIAEVLAVPGALPRLVAEEVFSTKGAAGG